MMLPGLSNAQAQRAEASNASRRSAGAGSWTAHQQRG